jgi:hypothetical protein
MLNHKDIYESEEIKLIEPIGSEDEIQDIQYTKEIELEEIDNTLVKNLDNSELYFLYYYLNPFSDICDLNELYLQKFIRELSQKNELQHQHEHQRSCNIQ